MDERGLTLMEVTVVVVLAAVITLGLTGFYLSSQATWISASTQAMAQRDATTLLEAITRQAREAGDAVVLPATPGDSTNSELILYTKGFGTEIGRFSWDPNDSMVHQGIGNPSVPLGAVVPSIAERFKVSLDDSLSLIHLERIQLRGANQQVVTMRSSVKMYNQ
jgi:type II secretory pathway pseudopilin PulG